MTFQWTIIIFMFLAATNFSLHYYFIAKGKFEYYIDPLSPSPLELGTRAHPFRNLNLAFMEIHNELSFNSNAQIGVFLKENCQHKLVKGKIRFLQLKSVAINIYSTDTNISPILLTRPEVLFTEDFDLFSSKTSFNIYNSFTLNSDISDQIPDLLPFYEDKNIEILVE